MLPFPQNSILLLSLLAEILGSLPPLTDRKERTKILREKYAVTDESNGKLICTLCQMSFANTYTLVRHIEAAHIQLRTYECEFCEKSFKTQSQKSDHTKKIHLKEQSPVIGDLWHSVLK